MPKPIVALALAAAAFAPAAAQPPGSRQTRDFVAAASHSDTFELEEATTALAESKNPQVRAFAEQMLRDHHQTGQALRDATARAGLEPPVAAVGSDQAPLLAALQSLRGHDFDRAYAHQQALSHRAALVTEQMYAGSGDNAAVRQAAAAAVPIISAHLQAAEQLDAQMGGS